MEGQELQGDDTEDALQTVHSMWQLNGLVGILTDVGVILATKDDRPARSGCDLLQSVLALAVTGVSHDDHDHRHLFVYQRQGAVLELSSQNAL